MEHKMCYCHYDVLSYKVSHDLISAIRTGDLDKVKTLINYFDLAYLQAWSQGYNLLCEAIQKKHTAVAKLLINSGSQVNSKCKCPTDTPLHCAVKNDNVKLVNMLLHRHANVNARNRDGETPLHFAVRKRNPKIIDSLLKKGANTEVQSAIGGTPLHRAVKSGNVEITKRLLNHQACINTADSSKRGKRRTPLHYASAQGHRKLVKLLLDRGANINARTKGDNSTALHLAAQRNRKKVVSLLLEYKGCDVNAQNKDGKTILQIAVEKGDLSTVKHILELCPKINIKNNENCLRKALYGRINCKQLTEILLNYGFTVNSEDAKNCNLLHIAVENGYLKIIEDLLRYGADSSQRSNKYYTLLHNAVYNQQIEAAKLLIKHGANVNAKAKNGKPPIYHAIECMDLEMTELLLSSGANAKDCCVLLHTAVRRKSKEIVEIILRDPDVDINAKDSSGQTALYYTLLDEFWDFHDEKQNLASVIFNRGMAEMFLSRGADVNAQTEYGLTPLHVAVECGNASVVEIFLEYNAKVNSATDCKKTPLHYSARVGSEIVTRMLLNKGANVNAKDESGHTPLHVACKNDHKNVVATLLEYGAEIDSRDNEDKSPLLIAAVHGSFKAVKSLMKLSAEIECKDKNGRTALHIAAKLGWTKVVKELLDHGADINVTCQKGNTPLDYADGTGIVAHIRHDQLNDRFDDYGLEDSDSEDYSDSSMEDNRNYFSDQCCYKISGIIKQHIIKMKTLNLYISRQNLQLDNIERGHEDFEVDCRYEAKMMEKEKIGDTNISFHNLLTKGICQLAICARNERIVEVLESGCHKEEFPIYANMIHNNFRRGQIRESLLNLSFKSLNFLSGFLLPDLVSLELLSHLSNKDLENLIKAMPNTVRNETADYIDSTRFSSRRFLTSFQ